MPFSVPFTCKIASLLFHYPSAIIRLPKGFAAVAEYIDRRIKEAWSKNPVAVKRICGFDIYLNPKDLGVCPSIGSAGFYELETTELIRGLLWKDMTFVDVGANIGWYTLHAASLVGTNGKVVAFEPDPTNLGFLRESVSRNKWRNVVLLQQCATDTEGDVQLWLATDNLGSHSIREQVGEQKITVHGTTLDATMARLGIDHIDVLKIDAERAEPLVLRGASDLMGRSSIANIVLEWYPQAWDGCSHLINTLKDKYNIYQLVRSPFLIRPLGTSLPNSPCNLLLQAKGIVPVTD
jgi:FkbM family methyltransferase